MEGESFSPSEKVAELPLKAYVKIDPTEPGKSGDYLCKLCEMKADFRANAYWKGKIIRDIEIACCEKQKCQKFTSEISEKTANRLIEANVLVLVNGEYRDKTLNRFDE